MAKNRYAGVLKPLQVGRGSPEVSVLLIYDVEDDRVRTRVADACLDYGLERIQFSAFFGKLNRNRRQELALRLLREMGKHSARVRMVPICEQDLADVWIHENFRTDVDELKKRADAGRPQLRVLRSGEEDA